MKYPSSFFYRQDESFSGSFLILLLSAFFIRFIPSLFFFGSSEITEYLYYFDNMESVRFPQSDEFREIPSPLIPVFSLFPLLHQLTGLPLVFWIKFPGIMADIGITCTIYFLAYQGSQDQKRAFSLALLYAFNPVSIIITSFVGSNTSVGLAFLMVSYCLCFIFRNIPLSAVFFATAVTMENIFILLLPVFLLKTEGKRRTRILFSIVTFLTFLCWRLPVIANDGDLGALFKFSHILENLQFGLFADLDTIMNQDLYATFPKFMADFALITRSTFMFCSEKFPFLLLPGLILISLSHKRRNIFTFTSCIFLLSYITTPYIRPFHFLWLLPFLILTLNGFSKIIFSSISLFLIAWYSIVSIDSGTFCGVKFLNFIISDTALYKEKWIHWVFFITGNLIIPAIFLLSLAVFFLAKPKAMELIKTRQMSNKTLFFAATIMGSWVLLGVFFSSGLFPPEKGFKFSGGEINHSTNHTAYYGGSFYYRNIIHVDSEVRRAIIRVSSDDFLIIYLNGNRVYSGYGNRYGYLHDGDIRKKKESMNTAVDLTPYLRQGKNVLGIESVSLSIRAATGLAVIWEIAGEKWEKFSVPFLKGWKAKAYPTDPGWMFLEFNDSKWEPPVFFRQYKQDKSLRTIEKGEKRIFINAPIPPISEDFFFMLPQNYSPQNSPVSIMRILVFYTGFFLFFQYFFEKNLRRPYLFFGSGAT